MSHEPLTINNRLIDESFDYILWVLCIKYYVRIPILTLAPAHPLGNTSMENTRPAFGEKPSTRCHGCHRPQLPPFVKRTVVIHDTDGGFAVNVS